MQAILTPYTPPSRPPRTHPVRPPYSPPARPPSTHPARTPYTPRPAPPAHILHTRAHAGTHTHTAAHAHAHTRTHAHTHTHAYRPRATPDQINQRQPLNTSYSWQPSGHLGKPCDGTPCAHISRCVQIPARAHASSEKRRFPFLSG